MNPVLGSKYLYQNYKLNVRIWGKVIEAVKEAKLLGRSIDETMSSSSHIDKINFF